MTARLVPAAAQLIRQVEDLRKTKVTLGDPDGLDRIRSVTFDAATSRWLVPILSAIGDERINEVHYEGKGRATVTFVPGYRADFKTAYPLAEVAAVLND